MKNFTLCTLAGLNRFGLFVFCALIMGMLVKPQHVSAEGTREVCWSQATNAPDSTATTQNAFPLYQGGGRFATFFARPYERLYIHIDQAGEIINMGFCQVTGVGANGAVTNLAAARSAFYRLRDPNGNIVVASAQVPSGTSAGANNNGIGWINSYKHAFNGPSGVAGVTSGYTPVTYTTLTTGDYWLEFNMQSGASYPTNPLPANTWPPTPAKNDTTTTTATDNLLKFLDVTVCSNNKSKKYTGRIWTKCLALYTLAAANTTPPGGGATQDKYSGNLYVYTSDSIVNELIFNGMFNPTSPNYFELVSNDFGVVNTGNPATSGQSYRKKVFSGSIAKYQEFLNRPDSAINAFPLGHSPNMTLNQLQGCKGNGYTINVTITHKGQSQFFIELKSPTTGKYQAGTKDVLLSNNLNVGVNTINWNGLDGLGGAITSGTNLPITLNYLGGITHFPLYDMEEAPNGFTVQTIHPSCQYTTLYFDDTKIAGGATNLPAGDVGPIGGAAPVPTHIWTTTTTDSSNTAGQALGNNGAGFGNWRMINTWNANTYSIITVNTVFASDNCPNYAYTTPSCVSGYTTNATLATVTDLDDKGNHAVKAAVLDNSISPNALPPGVQLSAGDGRVYVASPASLPTPSVTTTYSFTVLVTDSLNSKADAVVTLTFYPALNAGTLTQPVVSATCVSGTPGAITNTAASGDKNNTYTYQWLYSQNGGGFSTAPGATSTAVNYTPPILTPSVTTTYLFERNVNGATCAATSNTVSFVVNAPPVANAGSNATINNTQSTTIGGAGNTTGTGGGGGPYTYAWSPAAGLNSITTGNPIASPSVTTTYKVVVTDNNTCTASSSVVISVNPTANISITKTASAGPYHDGQPITYTIVVNNAGPNNATGVNVTDALPSGLTFISSTASVNSYNSGTGAWPVGNLAASGSATLTIVAKPNSTNPVTNTASVTATETNLTGTITSSAGPSTILPTADLSITKVASGAPYNNGKNATYTIVVSNAGPDAATGVDVTDALPSGLTFVSSTTSVGSYNNGTGHWLLGATLNPGFSATLVITAAPNTTGTINNAASVTGNEFDSNAGNNSTGNIPIVVAPTANITINKTASAGPYHDGQPITYTITVNNAGPDGATGVNVTDALPSGLTFISSTASVNSYNSGTGAWPVGNLAVSGSATLTIVAKPNSTNPVTNTASVTATETNLTGTITSSAGPSTILPTADLSITKVASGAPYNNGKNATYTIVVSNAGPDAATNVDVTDALPGGLTFVSSTASVSAYNNATGHWLVGGLGVGSSATLVITAAPNTTGTINNAASVLGNEFDNNVANNNTGNIPIVVAPTANISITKTASAGPYHNGQPVTYTIVVNNAGPDGATGVNVTDALPSGLTFISSTASVNSYNSGTGAWPVGNLAVSGSATLTIVAKPNSTNPITNTASVTAIETNLTGTVTSSFGPSTILPTADLSITKVASGAPYSNGKNATYTIVVTNNGPDAATGVDVTDALPGGLTFVSSTASVGSYSNGSGHWLLGATLNTGSSATLVITAAPNTTGTINNAASATGNEFDNNAGNNNTGNIPIVVGPTANLTINKTTSAGPYHNGQPITYTITVNNAGPDGATGVNVTDALPSGLTFVSSTASVNSYNNATGIWPIGNLSASATVTLTIVAKPNSTNPVSNSASVAGNEPNLKGTPTVTTPPATILPTSDLSVAKSVNGGPTYSLGQTIVYTIVATNNGPDVSSSVTVNDALPSGLTFVSSTASAGSYSGGVWTVGSLNGASSATLTITVTTNTTGSITNTASTSGPNFDNDGTNNSSTVIITVGKATDLSVTKTASAGPYRNGQNVTYTITAANAGPDNATGVKVTDLLPPGLTFVSATATTGSYTSATGIWNIGALNNGNNTVLTVVATPNTTGTITNNASVTGNETDNTSSNNTVSLPIVVAPSSNLSITKTASAAAVNNGQNITYTITINNAGPDNATNVAVTDALPSGLTFVSSTASVGSYTSATGTWAVGGLNVGTSATLTIVTTANTTGTITNNASVLGTEFDVNTANNSTSVNTTVNKTADVFIAKTVSAGPYNVNTNVTYTITLSNAGPDNATGLQVTDLLPSGLSYVTSTASTGSYNAATGVWNAGSLAPTGNSVLTITAKITSSSLIVNSASITAANEFDSNTGNNTATASVSAGTTANLKVTKTVSGSGPFANGQNVTFIITANNQGPNDASGVHATDLLSSNFTLVSATASKGTYTSGNGDWNIGSITNGNTETLTIVATINTTGNLTNTATITGGDYDPDNTDNSATATVTVGSSADMSIVKTVSAGPYRNGQNITYTLTVNNQGPNDASGVKVNDLLPAGLTYVSSSPTSGSYNSSTGVWNIGSMLNGTTEILTVTAKINNSGTITNTAAVVANENDPNAANSTSSSTINATPTADLKVIKTVNAGPYNNGQTVIYTLVASNAGPDNGTGVSVTDLLPSGLQFVSANPSAGTYTSGTGAWAIGSLAVNTTATLAITAKITGNGSISNTASINGTNYDSDPTNNNSTSAINVGTSADLTISKSAAAALSGSYRNGDTVTYTIIINNNGPNDATGVQVSDVLPASLAYLNANATSGSYNSGNGIWSVGVLPNGVPATLTLKAVIVSSGNVVNTATVSGADYDGNTSNNTATSSITAAPSADLNVVKTVSAGPYNVAGSVTYTVKVTGKGPDNATNVVVTDILPAQLAYVSQTSTTGSYNAATGTWTIGNLTKGASQTLTVTANVTATGVIANSASITANEFDRNLSDNTSTSTINVGTTADLSITKTAPTGSYYNGDNITYTIHVKNNGSSNATGVVATDNLSSSLTFVSATATTGSYVAGTGAWTIGSMINGATETLTITAKINNVGSISNIATVTGNDYDPITTNNTTPPVTINAGLAADVSVTKVASATPYYDGQNVTYTLTASNAGPNTANNVIVNDLLPAGLTFVSASSNVGAYNNISGSWTIGPLNNGNNATLTIIAKMNTTGNIVNNASITATEHDPSMANNTASSSIAVQKSSDIVVLKTVSSGPYNVSGVVTYTIKVSNNGPDNASGINVTDILPGTLSTPTVTASSGTYNVATGVWSFANLFNNTSQTLTIKAVINNNGAIANTATATATEFDPDMTNNSSTVNIGVGTTADLKLVKTVSAGPYYNGQSVVYTLTASNAGPDNASGVLVNDLLPAGLQFVSASTVTGTYNNTTGKWIIGALNNSSNATLTINAQVVSATSIVNTATIAGNDYDPNTSDNTSTATFTALPAANLAVTKTAGGGPYTIGNQIAYTVTINNLGPDNATNVAVNDLLPVGLQFVSASSGSYNASTGVWSVGNLNNGSTNVLTITTLITSNGVIANTANVTAKEFDNNTLNNTATSTINVGTSADLSVKKSISAAPYNNGQNVTYTLLVKNNGPSAATGVKVNDLLPAGLAFASAQATNGSYDGVTGVWTLGSMSNGASETLTINAKFISKGKLANKATISGNDYDPITTNNIDSVVIYVNATANLSVHKTAPSASAYTTGGIVNYTLTIGNAGPDNAGGVKVTDLLPSGLSYASATASRGSYNPITGIWTLGSLPIGATEQLIINANITGSGSITNNASIQGDDFDNDPTDNISAKTINVGSSFDLSIAKTVPPGSYKAGDLVIYTLTANNNDPTGTLTGVATGVVVNDLLPAGLQLVPNGATPSKGSYSSTSGVWTINTLSAGSSATLQLTTIATQSGVIVNKASISSNDFDPNHSNDTASATIQVTPQVNVYVKKTTTNMAYYNGHQVVYSIVVGNKGNDNASNVVVKDILPAGLSFVSAAQTNGLYNPTTGLWSIGSLPKGNIKETLIITAKITTAGAITNAASVSANEVDVDLTNNADSTQINVLPNSDVAVTKTATPGPYSTGATVIYTLTATNQGPDVATGITVTENLPALFTLISANPSKGTFNGSQWGISSLNNGETATLTITGTINGIGVLKNTIFVNHHEHDDVVANDTAKVIINNSTPHLDLAVTNKVSAAPYKLGQNVTYTLNVVNNGPDNGTGVAVAYVLPPSLQYVSATLSNGTYDATLGRWTLGNNMGVGNTATAVITATIKQATGITTLAKVTANETDVNPLNDTASQHINVPNLIDLAVTNTALAGPYKLGQNVTYTVVATNNGPADATGAKVAYKLPAKLKYISSNASIGSYDTLSGNWTIGNLASGNNTTLVITAKTKNTGAITTLASVSGNESDTNPINDTASRTITVDKAVDLKVTKTAAAGTYKKGDVVTYTITIKNTGPDVATNVVLTEVLPSGLTYNSSTTTSGTYSTTTGKWSINSLPVGITDFMVIKARLETSNTVTNTVNATADQGDLTPTDNNGSATITPDVTNLPPIARDTCVDAIKNILLNINVVQNCSDPEGQLARGSVIATALNGTIVSFNADHSLNYRPLTDFVGVDTIYYTVADMQGLVSNKGRICVNIKDANLVPSAFSPDGDGKNDKWVIKFLESYSDNEVLIFNRWGDEVMRRSGYNEENAWDGSNLPGGTYYYIIKYKNPEGKQSVLSGYVMLMH